MKLLVIACLLGLMTFMVIELIGSGNRYARIYQELQRVTQLYCQQECLRRESDPVYKHVWLSFCENRSCDWWLNSSPAEEGK